MTVGVVDSIYDPRGLDDYNRFGRSFDVLNANVGSTTGHGYGVLTILTYFIRDPEYQLFQSINKNGNTSDALLMKSLGLAMDFDEVDILNMSVGCDHVSSPDKDCNLSRSTCALCEVAEAAVDAGITIVAAAGNKPHVESVCCPSLSSHIISVGGAVTRCTADSALNTPLGSPPQETYPPNAYWVRRSDGAGADGTYCSNRGCYLGESCRENSKTEPWGKNVEGSDRKPDILSPVHLPVEDDVGPLIGEGTSFAAPLVTAGVACTLEWARSNGVDITPSEIRQAIRDSGHDFPSIDKEYFSVQSFTNKVRDQKGMSKINFDDFQGPIDLINESAEYSTD